MGLFVSGARVPGSSYAFTFAGAGSYPYEDTANLSTGTVAVPVVEKPRSGGVGTTFTITWASGAASPGYVYDVQIKRPGSSKFVSWQLGVTSPSATFTPDVGAGTYSFRAKLRKTGNGAHSGYSAKKSIKVT